MKQPKKVKKSHITQFLRSKGVKVPAAKMNDIPWLRGQVEANNWQDEISKVKNILWIFEDDVPRETPEPKNDPIETPEPKEDLPKKKEEEEEPAPAPPTPDPIEDPASDPQPKEEEPTDTLVEEENPDEIENVFHRLDNARVEHTEDTAPKTGLVTITQEPKKPKATRKTRKKKEDISYIEGYILLVVADILFPTAFVFLFNMFSKKRKIDFGEMTLTPEEEEKLQPLADKAAEHMQVKMSPVAMLGISMAVVYAQKAVGVIYSKK